MAMVVHGGVNPQELDPRVTEELGVEPVEELEEIVVMEEPLRKLKVGKNFQDDTKEKLVMLLKENMHVKGKYQARGPKMAAYLERVRGYLGQLDGYSIEKIPRERNIHVDALAKLASTKDGDTLKSVPVEYLSRPSIIESDVHMISIPKESWANPIINYLKDGALPTEKREAQRLVYKVAQYTLVDGVLYKREFSVPLLRCVDDEEARKVLYEIHEGKCGNHASGPSTAMKSMRQGYEVPFKIISDNGTQFEGETFEEYCKEKGIRRSFSAVVHPHANGQVEAINKVLKKNLKTK
ncbi:uncharacterized protein LOC133832396 [Humulus lupulus]|uniref:uncharacterized protein LOC133832396 n=1 Tax=Humulus lupulus TaxID=3486 RepID=UPI002B40454F|nr:uncharacterized protein LOC133832396 [Humulus lupulus]